ncbi:MAG: hypothetical protein AMXMBFR46_00530 [Acidimicrobiia bacterium]
MIEDAIADYQAAVGEGWTNLTVGRDLTRGVDRADASRFLAGLVEGALTFVHADPSVPQLVPWTTADRRWADNGLDSSYWYAPLDDRHRYRVHGRRQGECYLSFTVYAGTPAHPEHTVLNVNHLGLGAGPGEPFSLDIDPPPDACYLIVRQYFDDASNAIPASLAIDVVDGPRAVAPDDAALAARWRIAADFIRTMTHPPEPQVKVSYVSETINRIGVPSGWREQEGAGRGTPDQTYALGRFRLGPDDALVMDTVLRSSVYTSVVLWNQFGQTIDRRLHTSTLNRNELVTGSDGRVRIVVAHRDPGVPNWLDAAGRETGTIFWRFLLAAEQPEPIEAHVVPVDGMEPLA